MQPTETHGFSDTEVARVLYPWGAVAFVEPRDFDLDACVERYANGLPRKSATNAHPWRDDFVKDASGKRGVLSDEEARFWFVALTDPARLEDDRQTQATVESLRAFDPVEEVDVRARFVAWIDAFSERYRNLRLYSQAYLGRLMLQLVGLEETLSIVLDTLDAQWLSSFLDELHPTGEESPQRLAAIAEHWLEHGTKMPGWQTDQPRHSRAIDNAKQRLLPLTRPSTAVRQYLSNAHGWSPKSDAPVYHVLNAEPDDDAFLEFLESYKPELGRREVVLLLGRFGFEGCDWITKRVRASRGEPNEGLVNALAEVRSPRVVPALLHLAEQTTTAVEAREVLEDADLPYAIGLVTAASGRTKSRGLAAELLGELERENPELYQRALAAQPDGVQQSVAERVSATVVEERPELVEEQWPNWMHELHRDERPTGLPRFCAAKHLRPLYLADGEHQVPQSVVYGLLQTLRDHDWQQAEHGVFTAPMRVDLDTDSAAQFLWAIFESWTHNGFPTKYDWCMFGIAELATDAQMLQFARGLEEWPAIGHRQRAYDGLTVLEAHGSDTALATLNKLAKSSKFKGMRSAASYALTRLATRRGLTPGQLEDLIIDDCGLDDDGTATFDYGPRQFTLSFSPELKPQVRASEDGKTHKSLPRKRKTDDADLVAAEKARYKTMKKRLSDVIKLQARRLEGGLGERRRWRRRAWFDQYVRHSVMTHIVQRLLWAAFDDDEPKRYFRVTAERGLADVDDEAVQLDDNVRVGLAHPLAMDAAQIDEWGTVFGDYELIPPFAQLERETYEAPGDKTYLVGMDDVEITPGWLRGHFNNRGWSKSPPLEGFMPSVYRDFHAAEVRAYATLDPGLNLNYKRDAEQRIVELYFVRRAGRRETDPIRLQNVDPIAYSEAVYDVRRLVDRARETG